MFKNRWIILLASFSMMFCVGGIYAWSAFAYELMKGGYISATQSQVIFSSIVGGFSAFMILVGKLERKLRTLKKLVLTGAILFSSGYFLVGFSGGDFLKIWLFLGVLGALGIGIIYTLGVGIPIRWFPPDRKGLVTGVSVGGFGLGAIVLPFIISYLIGLGYNIFQVFMIVGLSYLVIVGFSALLFDKPYYEENFVKEESGLKVKDIFKRWTFWRLWLGIFCGTFGGMMVAGSLKSIGLSKLNNESVVTISISLFAFANFMGRIVWGWIGDLIGSPRAIVLSFLCGAFTLLSLNVLSFGVVLYLVMVFLLGFSYGANFVLFARETAERYGVDKVTLIYPFVFLGYSLASFAGPILGGFLYDLYGNYNSAILISFLIMVIGIIIFFKSAVFERKALRMEG
ncbi:MAG: MFS transporter [Synergistetes bacterium]|nr:MFS transporter [Synergistota bacterium]MCX8128297.1 MFS transporter [Synergistota bacterium]MDW8192611.1 MFS transporter [Synergistota bacterium]